LTVIGGATLLWVPGCVSPGPPDMPPAPDEQKGPTFFTDVERQTLAVLADYVLPPDDVPGGAALGAVAYIEQLLTGLETDPPRLYAGGPFSDRNPVPLLDGRPSNVKPENDFSSFLPLTREQKLFWQLQLYGSDSVPGGGPNDAAFGKTVGWRDLCRQGLSRALQLAGQPLSLMDQDTLTEVWQKLPPDFVWFVTERVVEAAFGAPEYGGNKDLAGWKMIHFEGDTLPYGYANYDETTGAYVERPDAPVSTRNPGADLDPIDNDTDLLLKVAVSYLGGRTAP
jgi:hypothetical protein